MFTFNCATELKSTIPLDHWTQMALEAEWNRTQESYPTKHFFHHTQKG